MHLRLHHSYVCIVFEVAFVSFCEDIIGSLPARFLIRIEPGLSRSYTVLLLCCSAALLSQGRALVGNPGSWLVLPSEALLGCSPVLGFFGLLLSVPVRPGGRIAQERRFGWQSWLLAGALLSTSSELALPGWLLYLLWLGWRLGRLSWAGVPLQASPGPSGRAALTPLGVVWGHVLPSAALTPLG